jgi:hypothetical protein
MKPQRSLRRIPNPGINPKQVLQDLKSQGIIRTHSKEGDEVAEQLIRDGYIGSESLVNRTDKFTLLTNLIHDAKVLEVTRLIDTVPRDKIDDWIWKLDRYKYKKYPCTLTAIERLQERKVDKFAKLITLIKERRDLAMTGLIDTIRRQEIGEWITKLEKRYSSLPYTAVAIAKLKNRRGF